MNYKEFEDFIKKCSDSLQEAACDRYEESMNPNPDKFKGILNGIDSMEKLILESAKVIFYMD